MNNFVISLSTAQERREHIHQIFSSNNIDYTFFDAIKFNDIERIASEIGIDVTNSSLKPSETSCLLSHLYLWKKVIDDDLEYITIYEDDIHLGKNPNSLLSTYQWIPEGCEIIKLEYFYENICIDNKTIKKLSDSRNIFALTDKHLGCGGYIVSKKAAIKLIEFVRNYKEVLPVDHYIFNKFLLNEDMKIYQMVPAICIQDHKLRNDGKNFYSYLSEDRKIRKCENEYKIKLSLGGKIIREISRIKKNIFIKKDKKPKVKISFE